MPFSYLLITSIRRRGSYVWYMNAALGLLMLVMNGLHNQQKLIHLTPLIYSLSDQRYITS